MNFRSRFYFVVSYCLFSSIFFSKESIRACSLDTSIVYYNLLEALSNPLEVFSLDLSKNQLKEFPDEIFEFKNLRYLNLSSNKIQTLPYSIDSLTYLTELLINDNELTILPKSIWRLKELIVLDVSGNNIRELSVVESKASNLAYLDIGNNNLGYLPKQMFSFEKLNYFLVYGNPIRKISCNIIDLGEVTDIDVSGTRLKKIRSCISKMEKLTLLLLPDTISKRKKNNLRRLLPQAVIN